MDLDAKIPESEQALIMTIYITCYDYYLMNLLLLQKGLIEENVYQVYLVYIRKTIVLSEI